MTLLNVLIAIVFAAIGAACALTAASLSGFRLQWAWLPKRSPIPSLANLMEVDEASWAVMGRWSNRLAIMAVTSNFVVCAFYAFLVASRSELPLVSDWNMRIPMGHGQDFLAGATGRVLVAGVFASMQLLGAIVMQLGSDFAIPFAAGLAGQKYRLIPSLGVAAFLCCVTLTASIKIDVFTGWGRERSAAAVEVQTQSDADKQILDKYPAAPPPTIADSDAKIATATDTVADLKAERDRQVKTRDDEETRGGRGDKWAGYDAKVTELNGQLKTARDALTQATADRSDRIEYDKAKSHYTGTIRTTTASQRPLIYDSDFVVWLRGVGLSLISPFFVLCSFMIRASRAAIAKKREATLKGQQTRQTNANTFEADFEPAPLGARQVEHSPGAKDGAVATATTRTPRSPPDPRHPDAAGDDSVNGVNGYKQEGDNGTGSDKSGQS